MLYYKNNRFYIGGISYALPENICILTNFERALNNGFAYKSLDQKILVTINTDSISGGEYFNSEEFKEEYTVKEIKPFGYANIQGMSAMYASEYNEYYEVRLNLPHADADNTMIILVEVRKSVFEIKDAIMNSIVTDLLLSLRVDLSAPVFLL